MKEAKNKPQLIFCENPISCFSISFRFHVTQSEHLVSLTLYCINIITSGKFSNQHNNVFIAETTIIILTICINSKCIFSFNNIWFYQISGSKTFIVFSISPQIMNESIQDCNEFAVNQFLCNIRKDIDNGIQLCYESAR